MTAQASGNAASDLGKVAVLMGGASAERAISLLSGNAVLEALRRQGVDAHAFDPAERSLCELRAAGFARAFIALHGRGGEDGTVQGALDVLGIPYTGSGVMASALAMDKWRTKLVWQAAGLPTPASCLLAGDSDWAAVAAQLGLPIFVKPAREGSSVGATKVERVEDLPAAWAAAVRHDPLVLAEAFIAGHEVTCAFVGDEVLPLVRIVAPGGNYDYQNKYFTDDTRYHCPSGLPPEVERHAQALTAQAARLLDCRGWGRADLMIRSHADGRYEPFLLEMNTSPGMTGHSLVPMAARQAGMDFDALVLRILALAQVD
ncbi:MAG: D-alanine--D-alanine ligase [Betaproteobacteria bacterium]|nr:D-alanine--D-alanine ligase [Betaproteobacteria bacterium]